MKFSGILRLSTIYVRFYVSASPHRSVKALEEAINTFIASHNENPKPFIWVKTADQTIDSVGRFCKLISNSGH